MTARAPMLHGLLLGGTLLPLLLVLDAVRHPLESRMALHMLVEFPLLALGGAAAALAWRRAGPGAHRGMPPADTDHLATVAVSLAVSALWMVPAALDAALLQPSVAAAKYLSWWATGALLARSLPTMRQPLRIFFAGNLGWMLATSGLLYLEAEQRVCVSYRFNEQGWTGGGLCAAAALVSVFGLWPTESASGARAAPA